MDNFRRPKRSRRHGAIDGIISPKTSDRTDAGSLGFKRATSYQPRKALIGDFQGTDGFRAARQPVISNDGEAALAEPAPLKPAIHIPFLAKTALKEHKKEKSRSWKKILKRTGLVILALLVIVGAYLVGKAYLKARHVFKGGAIGAVALNENIDPSLLKGEGDGRVNVLILGKGGPGHEAPDLTDTLLVASFDPINKEAAILSVPRDLYVKIPNDGSMKVNAVYASAKQTALSGKKTDNQAAKAEKAGLEAASKTVEEVLGIPMHYYVLLDFEAFRKAIDTVGGITVNVPETLYDPSVAWENNNSSLLATKGAQNFNGKQALLYARSRQSSPRGDFDRAERQRLIMLALKDKVFSAGTFSNPLKVSQLIDAFGDHIQTNLSLNEVMRMKTLSKDVTNDKVASLSLVDPPNNLLVTASLRGQSIVQPQAGLYDYNAVHNFVRNQLKDGFIKSENPNVVVLNGTGKAGLATKKAEELRSYGYNVVSVADAPTKDYAKTMLVDLTNGQKKYTKRYLEQRFQTTATGSLPAGISPGIANFVIILGENASQ